MGDARKLVCAIIKFLNKEIEDRSANPDAREGIEVAVQCLESAYNIQPQDLAQETSRPLLELYSHLNPSDGLPEIRNREIPSADKLQAELYKNEGNSLMKSDRYKEALDLYCRAIDLDDTNAIYYCNRAAAYSKLGNHSAAIQDCKIALKIDPSYSKAYGRLGLAYSSLNQHSEAMESYKKALELEPGNESYVNNLRIAEDKLTHGPTSQTPLGAGAALPGGLDLRSILSNPALLNMATQMLSDPGMQNVDGGAETLSERMSNIMSWNLAQGGNDMEALLQVGQQLAQRMQSSNPDLVEYLRQEIESGARPNNPNSTNEEKPPQPPDEKPN